MDNNMKEEATKVFSVRLPVTEADRTDEMARASGMNRNDFIRLRLKRTDVFLDVGRLDKLVAELRKIECALDAYLDRLEALEDILRNDGAAYEDIALVTEEIRRASSLMELIFRTQKRTIQILNDLRIKLRQGGT